MTKVVKTTRRLQLKRRVIYSVGLTPIQSNKGNQFESPWQSLVKRRGIYKVGLDPFQIRIKQRKVTPRVGSIIVTAKLRQ